MLERKVRTSLKGREEHNFIVKKIWLPHCSSFNSSSYHNKDTILLL